MVVHKKNVFVTAAILGLMAVSATGMTGCGQNSCKGMAGCGGKNGCGGKDTATKVEDGTLKSR